MDLSPRGDVRKAGRFCVVEECVGKTQKGDPRRQQTPACVTFKIEKSFLQFRSFTKSWGREGQTL